MATQRRIKLEDWQLRVISEAEELSEKLDKLIAFASDDQSVDQHDVILLFRQSVAMYDYLNILVQRIEGFDNGK